MNDDRSHFPGLTEDRATSYTRVLLSNVVREFPSHMSLRLEGPADAVRPRDAYPAFYGAYDWHSCVHSWWGLVRLLRLFPEAEAAEEIAALFAETLTPAALAVEEEQLFARGRESFERPYGRAWLAALGAEAAACPVLASDEGTERLVALGRRTGDALLGWMEAMPYPIRAGTHANTGFALLLLAAASPDWRPRIGARLSSWYGSSRAAPDAEPSGDDFLSDSLTVASAMSRVLAPEAFAQWLERWMPGLTDLSPDRLFVPASVPDRKDYKLVHLEGLNLSRALSLRMIAQGMADRPAVATRLCTLADRHADAALPHLQDSYAGGHWLVTFAILAATGP